MRGAAQAARHGVWTAAVQQLVGYFADDGNVNGCPQGNESGH